MHQVPLTNETNDVATFSLAQKTKGALEQANVILVTAEPFSLPGHRFQQHSNTGDV